MEILQKNLDTLRLRDGELAERLSALVSGKGLETEETKSGDVTFRHEGRYFHSRYEPWREAESQLAEIKEKDPDWVLLFGLGCGYLLRLLAREDRYKVLVYEPSPEILATALTSVDLTEALCLEDVHLCGDLETVSLVVRDRVDGFDDLLGYQTVPYRQVFIDELKEFNSKVRNAHISTKVAVQTDIDSRRAWIENYLANIPFLGNHPPVDALKGAFSDVPAVIVGAGPSLAKNARMLKDLKGRVVIIAAITAYRTLVYEYGVVPDFIIAAEKVDLPHYFTGTETDEQTRLILGEISHPEMFTRTVKEKFVFYNAYTGLSLLQAKLWGSDYFASIGGSVTTAALDMAIMFGCPSVIFLGQDLSFSEDRSHAPGGVYEDHNSKLDFENGKVLVDAKYYNADEKQEKTFDILWLKGWDGKPVPSKYDWVIFHQWFESYMGHLKKTGSTVRVVNATEGGARIEGMEHTTLADAVERYVGEESDIEGIIDRAVASRPPVDREGLVNSFKDMVEGLRYIDKRAGRILVEARLLARETARDGLRPELKSRVERIQAAEKELFDRAGESPFIWEYLSNHTYKLKEYLREKEEENAEAQFSKDLRLMIETYTEVRDMCEELTPELEEAAVKADTGRKEADGAGRGETEKNGIAQGA